MDTEHILDLLKSPDKSNQLLGLTLMDSLDVKFDEFFNTLQEVYCFFRGYKLTHERLLEFYHDKSFDLSYMELTEIPNCIGVLSNLEDLYLNDNQLDDLPNNFGELTNLKYLCLRQNDFECIPECISKLNNLVELDLKHNVIYDLPDWLFEMKKLERINLLWNPLNLYPENLDILEGLKEKGIKIHIKL